MIPAERVMICMSSSALAPRVIAAGVRTAGQLRARLYAVYVETPREHPSRMDRESARALRQNMALAERLGATIVKVHAMRAADGLIAFAQREGMTHVIFGQTARSRWERLVDGSVVERFAASVPDVVVQVVPFSQVA